MCEINQFDRIFLDIFDFLKFSWKIVCSSTMKFLFCEIDFFYGQNFLKYSGLLWYSRCSSSKVLQKWRIYMHCEFNLLVVCKKSAQICTQYFCPKLEYFTQHILICLLFFEKQKCITSFSLKQCCFSDLPSYISSYIVYAVKFLISYYMIKKQLTLLQAQNVPSFLETTTQ